MDGPVLDTGPDERPQYVLESHEDEFYHDKDLGERSTEPEYYAFVNRIWTFNSAMQWVRPDAGNIICYCSGGNLPLTGIDQVSAWHTDPANAVDSDGAGTRFIKKSKRRRDCIVLPAFQFDLDQYPKAQLRVMQALTDWQFCVFVKGRSGPPLVCSGWQTGQADLTFDLAGALRGRGYNMHFPELHFVLGLWAADDAIDTELAFDLSLPSQAAVVPCLPVIRTQQTAETDGVPVTAVAVDVDGELLGANAGGITATVAGQVYALEERNGAWTTVLADLVQGEYEVELTGEGGISGHTSLHVRVTDGDFVYYDSECGSLARGGKPIGPISGSYQGMTFFRDVGGDGERMVQGQQDWDAWDRTVPPGEHWHYWEAMTEHELDQRLAYLKQCGWQLLHLCQHWGVWEKLDAGGRIAPHGVEQLALFLRIAARHGLLHLQALSHYPYGTEWTPPFKQYWDAGFKDEDWYDPASEFTVMFHEYLRDFVTLFREESALFAMSGSGEGDAKAGVEKVNDTCRFLRSLDSDHLLITEPIGKMNKLPHTYYDGWDGSLYGSRMYWIGTDLEPDLDLGVEFKFLQLGPVFMAEGSWPCPPLYARFAGNPDSWTGTPRYRIRLRDSIYLGLTHRNPIILTWDEQCAEDERIVFDEVRRSVDWSQPFMPAPVALRVGDVNVAGKDRAQLLEYERLLAGIPVASRYILPDADEPMDSLHVIDARDGFQRPGFISGDGRLTDEVDAAVPLRISDGYHCSYLWSADRTCLLAYVYCGTRYLFINRKCAKGNLFGNIHRSPVPTALHVKLRNLPDGLRYRLYDLNGKNVVDEGNAAADLELDLGMTDKDYFVCVSKA